MSAEDVVIGAVLRELREDAGMSQTAVSEELACARGLIGMYERGARTVSLPRLVELAACFGCELSVLLSVLERRVQMARVP